MNLRTITAAAALLLASAVPAAAQAVKLEFVNGRVNLTAENVPARVILAEWARLGGTRIVNGDRVAAPVSVQLTGASEREALDIILRGVAGYMATARTAGGGASLIDRVMILPTSTAPRNVSTTPTFTPAPTPVVSDFPQDEPAPDDPTEVPVRTRIVRPPVTFGGTSNGVTLTPGNQPVPAGAVQGGAPQSFVPASEPDEMPAPRPGINVGPSARPSNPFAPSTGSARPGQVTPAPQDAGRPPSLPPPPEE